MTPFDWVWIVWLLTLTVWIGKIRLLQMRLAGTVLALAEFLKGEVEA